VIAIEGALILSGGLNSTTSYKRLMKRLPDELLKPV
jgi:hypothetical protein